MSEEKMMERPATCGGDNCMGQRLDGVTNWVTEAARDAAVAQTRRETVEECALYVSESTAVNGDPLDESQMKRLAAEMRSELLTPKPEEE